MKNDITIARLTKNLRKIESKIAEMESRRDVIQNEISTLMEENSVARIESWGGEIDWPALLEGNAGITFSMLADYVLGRLGLGSGMMHSETGQRVLHIQIPAGETPAEAARYCQEVRESIDFIAPFLRPDSGGNLIFHVHACDDFSVSLQVTQDLSTAVMVWNRWGVETDRSERFSLGEALIEIQSTYPADPECYRWVPEFDPDRNDWSNYWRGEALAGFLRGAQKAGKDAPKWLAVDDLLVLTVQSGQSDTGRK